MERTQFTFYESFYKAIRRIRRKEERADAYDAIVKYALLGEEPDLSRLSNGAAIAFELIRPTLDSARKKAESGRLGGQANRKQTESKKEKENKKENKKKNDIEIDIENEAEIEADRERRRLYFLDVMRQQNGGPEDDWNGGY